MTFSKVEIFSVVILMIISALYYLEHSDFKLFGGLILGYFAYKLVRKIIANSTTEKSE